MKKIRIIYNSIFIPEEMIRAAGAEPFPLYLHIMQCSEGDGNAALRFMEAYSRSVLKTVLDMFPNGPTEGNYLVMAAYNSHSMRMIEMLRDEGFEVFSISVPPMFRAEQSEAFYLEELERLRNFLEEISGIALNDESIARGYREMTSRLNDESNVVCAEKAEDEARIVLTATMFTSCDREFVELAASSGISIVSLLCDDGDEALKRIVAERISRSSEECLSVKSQSPESFSLKEICESRYHRSFPPVCFLDSSPVRYECIKKSVGEYEAAGIVLLQMCFDELSELENEQLSAWAGADEIRNLRLEISYEDDSETKAALETRLESFAMMLGQY